MRYGEAGYFWVDQSDGKNIVLLGSSTEGTNRMNTKDADGYQMVKEKYVLQSRMVVVIQIMYFLRREKQNLHQSVLTANTSNLLTGLLVLATILIT